MGAKLDDDATWNFEYESKLESRKFLSTHVKKCIIVNIKFNE